MFTVIKYFEAIPNTINVTSLFEHGKHEIKLSWPKFKHTCIFTGFVTFTKIKILCIFIYKY